MLLKTLAYFPLILLESTIGQNVQGVKYTSHNKPATKPGIEMHVSGGTTSCGAVLEEGSSKSCQSHRKKSSSPKQMSSSSVKEGLLVDISEGTKSANSYVPPSKGSKKPVNSFSIFDCSIDDKYAFLPPPMGERGSVADDPFIISDEVKQISCTAAPGSQYYSTVATNQVACQSGTGSCVLLARKPPIYDKVWIDGTDESDGSAPPVPTRDYPKNRSMASHQVTFGDEKMPVYANHVTCVQTQTKAQQGVQNAKVRPFNYSSNQEPSKEPGLTHGKPRFGCAEGNFSSQTLSNSWQSANTSCNSNYVDISAVLGQFREVERPMSTSLAPSEVEMERSVQQVQRLLPGVLKDEIWKALHSNRWGVQAAVRDLKVEQLFRLGITSRERCKAVLEASKWDMETAGSILIDQMKTGSL